MEKIKNRGISYIEAAIDNWAARENKMKEAWCAEFIHSSCYTERQKRIFRIANELEKRHRILLEYRYNFLEKEKQKRIESDHEHIHIRCRNIFCKTPTGMAFYRKDYKPGEHHCTYCNSEMMTDDEYNIIRNIENNIF